MYRSEPLFPYIKGQYAIMPSGLPSRFYPTEESRVHKEKEYVICFDKDVPDEKKQRFIKEYADYYSKKKESGLF